jgi:DnaJ-class molecular chaperone
MDFGKRGSTQTARSTPQQQTCLRCYGTGHVRERGSALVCKVCAGTGRIKVAPGRKTA